MISSPYPDIPILFMNEDMIVISKPCGLPVHAGPGGGITLDDYLPDFQFEKKQPPALAHRLDRDTSGCLILGRTKAALRLLGTLFELKRIQKTYWAVTHGTFPAKQMRIDMPLAKLTAQKHRWHMQAVKADHPAAQSALTDLRVQEQNEAFSWVALQPRTGRTHQLRVHCAANGCPIVGDTLYGGERSADPLTDTLLLHARSLKIPYDRHGEPIIVEAPLPQKMAAFMTDQGFSL